MPAPKAIVCHLCNGKYFKRSYPIHLKQCEAKWKKTHSRCEYCGSAVSKHDWSDHRSHCRPTKRKLSEQSRNMPLQVPKGDHQQLIPTLNNKNQVVECQECETENASWQCVECEQSLCAMCEVDLHRKGSRLRHTRIPMNAQALNQENLALLTQSDCKQTALTPPRQQKQDHRAQCKFCSRRFNPERVEKHMRICAKAMKKKRRIYDGAKKRIEDTPFAAYEYHRSATPEKVKEWKKNGRRWKTESCQLRGIAAINNDKQLNENCDKKDEESDIIIKAPAKKPVFRPNVSKPSQKKTNLPLKASSLKMKQRSRPSSNYSSKSINNKRMKKRETNSNNAKSNISKSVRRGRFPTNKKPSIPKFDRRKSVPNNNRIALGKAVPNNNRKAVPDKRLGKNDRTMESKTINKANVDKTKLVEKDSKIRKEKATFKRTSKSAANSLPRGIELGVNVNKMFNDEPVTMSDYVKRERLRRQRGAESNATNKSKQTYPPKVALKKKSRIQIKKEIKIDNQPIGGRTANKPSNSRDLASKRAAYFESLLQNQD